MSANTMPDSPAPRPRRWPKLLLAASLRSLVVAHGNRKRIGDGVDEVQVALLKVVRQLAAGNQHAPRPTFAMDAGHHT